MFGLLYHLLLCHQITTKLKVWVDTPPDMIMLGSMCIALCMLFVPSFHLALVFSHFPLWGGHPLEKTPNQTVCQNGFSSCLILPPRVPPLWILLTTPITPDAAGLFIHQNCICIRKSAGERDRRSRNTHSRGLLANISSSLTAHLFSGRRWVEQMAEWPCIPSWRLSLSERCRDVLQVRWQFHDQLRSRSLITVWQRRPGWCWGLHSRRSWTFFRSHPSYFTFRHIDLRLPLNNLPF